ncbi:hypothetical protein, partial [Aeromonas veronii]|uniref:hypothetical protein n=1 Tax=Aeromonas veronii TaxID=654 RepID=UPI001CA564C4
MSNFMRCDSLYLFSIHFIQKAGAKGNKCITGAGRDYTFCEQFASVVTPKNISIRKSSLQQAHLI